MVFAVGQSVQRKGRGMAIGFERCGVCRALTIVFAMHAGLVASGYAADKYKEMINCDLNREFCSRSLAGSRVTLAVSPRPVKAMADLIFKVGLEDNPALEARPFIDLSMPGMNMGKNRILLGSDGTGTYTGTGVIVRCKSGRRVWRATVTLPGLGRADFVFDVIY